VPLGGGGRASFLPRATPPTTPTDPSPFGVTLSMGSESAGPDRQEARERSYSRRQATGGVRAKRSAPAKPGAKRSRLTPAGDRHPPVSPVAERVAKGRGAGRSGSRTFAFKTEAGPRPPGPLSATKRFRLPSLKCCQGGVGAGAKLCVLAVLRGGRPPGH
jgi:hypothetical protein